MIGKEGSPWIIVVKLHWRKYSAFALLFSFLCGPLSFFPVDPQGQLEWIGTGSLWCSLITGFGSSTALVKNAGGLLGNFVTLPT